MTNLPQPSRRSALGLLGAGSLACTGLVGGAGPALGQSDAKPRGVLPGGEFDRFVAGKAARDLFSGVVLLEHKGVPVLTRTYGYANRADSVPIELGTLFQLGSMSKLFTSTAIAKLVQRNLVAYDAPIGDYLDGFPAEIASGVTVHQLLTHSSGFGLDYRRLPEWVEESKKWTTAEQAYRGTMAVIRTMPLHFSPGSRYLYSNVGFFVLGAIVTEVSGTPLWDYIRRHVFAPARLRKTDFYTRQQVLNGREFAHGYGPPRPDGTREDVTEKYANQADLLPFAGGGGGYSNAAELLRFFRALLDGTLLEPGFAELLFGGRLAVHPEDRNPSELPDGPMFSGYGQDEYLVPSDSPIHRVTRRTGTSQVPGGISVGLSVYRDLDWRTVILSNYYVPINEFHLMLDRLVAGRRT